MIKFKRQKLLLALSEMILLFRTVYFAHAQEPSPSGFKAIVESSKIDGIRLSIKAVQRLQLKAIPYLPAATLTLKPGAVVHSLGIIGIYRLRDGWYKLIPAILVSKGKETMTLKVSDFKNTDQIVTEGVALLRVAEMDAFGGGE